MRTYCDRFEKWLAQELFCRLCLLLSAHSVRITWNNGNQWRTNDLNTFSCKLCKMLWQYYANSGAVTVDGLPWKVLVTSRENSLSPSPSSPLVRLSNLNRWTPAVIPFGRDHGADILLSEPRPLCLPRPRPRSLQSPRNDWLFSWSSRDAIAAS